MNKKINKGFENFEIDIPNEILKRVDLEARRIGVERNSLIKYWISQNVDRLAG